MVTFMYLGVCLCEESNQDELTDVCDAVEQCRMGIIVCVLPANRLVRSVKQAWPSVTDPITDSLCTNKMM